MMLVKKSLLGKQSQWWCKSKLVSSLHTSQTTTANTTNINNNNNNGNSNTKNEISLFKMISGLHNSITPILDQWVKQQQEMGNTKLDQNELKNLFAQLRKFRRYKAALQFSEWMGKNNQFEVTPGDVAIRLSLISKVHGIQKAEEYFNNIPYNSRDFRAYSSLLSCYVHEKSLEKAEATMQKMRELNFTTRLSYTVLMNLYFRMGKHEKLKHLVQEMEEKGIEYDKFTYIALLNAYATSSNLEAFEKLLKKMEADPLIVMDWHVYIVATHGYIRAGQMDKAFVTIRKVELLSRFISAKRPREFLLTMYARIGHKEEVYRVWDLFKKTQKMYNSTYLAMMSSLSKLDDIDGMEKIFEDWLANSKHFDFRIPNFLVTKYCRRGLLEKAELLIKSLTNSCHKPNPGTWDRLAVGYHKHGHMEKAVDAMKKALLVNDPGYIPNLKTLIGCMDYLEAKGDDEVAEFRNLLKERGHSINDIRDRIEKHIRDGTPGSVDYEEALNNDESLNVMDLETIAQAE